MRDIKFRARDTHNKIWLDPKVFSIGIDDGRLRNKECGGCIGGVIVEQFTGLHDKNGVELYEGDILKKDNGSLATIIFHDGCFRGKFIIETELFYFVTDKFATGQHTKWFEKIGTIHDKE